MSLVIVSGRSGSGKSTALHVLEDMGYYCIDNLPASLLPPLIRRLGEGQVNDRVAVSIDARNIAADLATFPDIVTEVRGSQVSLQIVYLDSSSPALVKRFSETRRKHPLSNHERNLKEALELETSLLDPISGMADLTIDTTSLTIHDLRDVIRSRVAGRTHEFALLFESFAYKSGVPVDADLVFDVRSLPNPHWIATLRNLTGLDRPVAEFLEQHADVAEMYDSISSFLDTWLPRFEANNRSYMTVAIGCTGGQHRSVYLANRLFHTFAARWKNVQIRHRELGNLGIRQENLDYGQADT
ncbi:MAG: RNase adapter RapZ [Pseudomonadales bacterium]|nr:RNase adapter RapZ [Pseudomonadales bacterium]